MILVGAAREVYRNLQEMRDRFIKFRDAVLDPINWAGMFSGLYPAARNALNNVIGLFNSLSLGLNFNVGGSRVGTTVSGSARKLAAGGVARATPGGIQATVAEGGKDEVVSPVEVMQDYIRTAVQEANAASGGGGDTVIQLYMFPNAAEYDRFVIGAAERNSGTIAKIANGGNKRIKYAT
jgi:hypothetical protein